MFLGNPYTTLQDSFLKRLYSFPERETHCKLISLDFNENPISEISGLLTAGSVSVDGSSAVRRTCNITMVTNQININELHWSLHTKYAVMIGLTNSVNPAYEPVIWFPQGIFILTNFSQTLNNSGYQIQITGKDKMCMLDGSVGGTLLTSHDFGKIENRSSIDNTTIDYEYIEIYQIIRNAVHQYGQEPWHNIIITDLDDVSVELLEYTLDDKDLFIYDICDNPTFDIYDSNMAFEGGRIAKIFTDNQMFDGDIIQEPTTGTYLRLVKHVQYKDTAGYRNTALTYPGDLVLEAGATITQLLDKIIEILGEYEYFYDIDGHFVFQRKKIYFNQSWNNAVTNDIGDTYYANNNSVTQTTWSFNRGELVESFSNRPNLLNIKNDFAVWGAKTGATGDSNAIHLRYAIDDKPTTYTSLRNGKTYTATQYDWRELIYQMAWDNMKYAVHIAELNYALYYNYVHCNEKLLTQYSVFTEANNKNISLYWYDSTDKKIMLPITKLDALNEAISKEYFIFMKAGEYETIRAIIAQKKGVNDLTFKSQYALYDEIALWEHTWSTGYDAYYADMLAFWRLVYCPEETDYPFYKMNEFNEYEKDANDNFILDNEKWQKWEGNQYWNPDIIRCDVKPSKITILNPGALFFWLEFIDTQSALGKFKPAIIGRRPKVVNDNEVKAIYYRDTPNVIFIDPENSEPQNPGISYTKLNLTGGMANYFYISKQGKSAKEVLDNLLYEHTHYQETITLSCLPIYHLQPNTRIAVEDETTGIRGEYIIKSFNYSLGHDGMMSITATRAVDRIL